MAEDADVDIQPITRADFVPAKVFRSRSMNTLAGRRQFDNSQECIAKNASGVAMRMKIRQSKTPQLRNDYSLTFPPLSIARYSFIQLSEHGRREVKENAQTSKRYQRGFEPGLSRLRVRHSTAKPPRYNVTLLQNSTAVYQPSM